MDLKKNRTFFKNNLIHPIKRRLAKYYVYILQRFFGLRVIAITGSAGKTTTKDMVASILSQKNNTNWSYANIDPIYNIPTTILKTKINTKYLVLEMGVEYKGEIDFYTWLVKPNIGVIINIFPTHTQFFENTKGVFDEKKKLIANLRKQDVAILNYNDKYLRKIKKLPSKTIWTNKDITAEDVKIDLKGTSFVLKIGSKRVNMFMPVVGEQFVQNALIATGVAMSCGISIEDMKRGLRNLKPAEHRMKIINHKTGAIIVDDSYNNNPKAAIQSFETLKNISKKSERVLVFGDMLELGKEEKKYHMQIAKDILKADIKYVICVGILSKHTFNALKPKLKNDVIWVKDAKQVAEKLQKHLKLNNVILIKGSRSIKLDTVITDIITS